MRNFSWVDVRIALQDLLKFLGIALGAAIDTAFVVLLVYALFLLVGLFAAPLVMWAWNGSLAVLFPAVFSTITYWQAFWLWALASLLVKSTNTNNSKNK